MLTYNNIRKITITLKNEINLIKKLDYRDTMMFYTQIILSNKELVKVIEEIFSYNNKVVMVNNFIINDFMDLLLIDHYNLCKMINSSECNHINQVMDKINVYIKKYYKAHLNNEEQLDLSSLNIQ